MTCLPDQLWTNDTFAWAKLFERRVWDFCLDVARLLASDPDAWAWPPVEMAIRLKHYSVRQVNRLAEKARDFGMMVGDSFGLVFETVWTGSDPKSVEMVSGGALRMRRLRERRQREEAAQQASQEAAEASHVTLDVTESAAAEASQTAVPSLSLAEASSLANKESFSSLAKAEAKPRESTNGKTYPNRARPTAEEICKLEAMGYTPAQIEQGVREVSARPKFSGSARWDLYLRPVLKDLFGLPGQGTMPMLGSVPGGAANKSGPARASPAGNDKTDRDRSVAWMKGEGPPPGEPPPMDLLRRKLPQGEIAS